jgi:hypothetical protein
LADRHHHSEFGEIWVDGSGFEGELNQRVRYGHIPLSLTALTNKLKKTVSSSFRVQPSPKR